MTKQVKKNKDVHNFMNHLKMFSANSANDTTNTHLWIKGASLFINQINELIKKLHTHYEMQISDIKRFTNSEQVKLGEILKKNCSDKSTVHNYHILYSYIFQRISSSPNMFEIGIGTNSPSLVSTMGKYGRPGASLYAFSEYLPNAKIYGADIDENILFSEKNIKTCYVNQLEMDTFLNIKKEFGDIKYDLIIDDGLHAIGANFNTLLFALDNLNINGWIVIEDISASTIQNWFGINFLLVNSGIYETYMIKTNKSYLFCVHLKKND